MGRKTFWQHANSFVRWVPVLIPGYIGLLGLLAAAAQANVRQAKAWLANQFVMLEAMMGASYAIAWLLGLTLFWVLALVWTGHKASGDMKPMLDAKPKGEVRAIPGITFHGKQKPSLPIGAADDLERQYWSLKDDMLVWQAAYLWHDLIPPKMFPGDTAPPAVRVQIERMTKALQMGLIKPVVHPDDRKGLVGVLSLYVNRTEYATVARDVLREYAHKMGETPPFLAS